MDVQVFSGPGQSRRHALGLSLFGDGLLERIRSTSIALVGVTGAVGLGLVAFALHQSWPIGENVPLPGLPLDRGGVDEAEVVAIAPSAERAAARPVPTGSSGGRDRTGRQQGDGPSGGSGVGGSEALRTSSPRPAAPGGGGGGEEPAPVSTPVAAETPPPSDPAPAAPGTVAGGNAPSAVPAGASKPGEDGGNRRGRAVGRRGEEPSSQSGRARSGGSRTAARGNGNGAAKKQASEKSSGGSRRPAAKTGGSSGKGSSKAPAGAVPSAAGGPQPRAEEPASGGPADPKKKGGGRED